MQQPMQLAELSIAPLRSPCAGAAARELRRDVKQHHKLATLTTGHGSPGDTDPQRRRRRWPRFTSRWRRGRRRCGWFGHEIRRANRPRELRCRHGCSSEVARPGEMIVGGVLSQKLVKEKVAPGGPIIRRVTAEGTKAPGALQPSPVHARCGLEDAGRGEPSATWWVYQLCVYNC